MKRSITAFVATAAMFIALDFLWLTIASPTIYQDEIGPLLSAHPRMVPAVLFYLLYLAGVVVFVVLPAGQAGRLREAALRGAFFGLVAYATYDLTNLATLEGFTPKLAIIDMAWGALVTGVSAGVGQMAVSRLKP